MPEYYVLRKPWGVYVKEADFFIRQGGAEEPWGRDWELVIAESIEDAREKAKDHA